MELPRPISIEQFTPPVGPSYTDIFHAVMGGAATPADGFDAAMADLAAVSNAFGAELGTSGLLIDPGTLAPIFAGIDPANLDAHMAGYVGAMDAGNAIVAAAGGAVTPQLLILPLTPGRPDVNPAPPVVVTHDFGTVKLGSPDVLLEFGRETDTVTGQIRGNHGFNFAVGVPYIFGMLFDQTENNAGDTFIDWTLRMVPAIVGQWTGQLTYISGDSRRWTIMTLTVNVIP